MDQSVNRAVNKAVNKAIADLATYGKNAAGIVARVNSVNMESPASVLVASFRILLLKFLHRVKTLVPLKLDALILADQSNAQVSSRVIKMSNGRITFSTILTNLLTIT